MGGFYGGMIAGTVSVLALGAALSLNTPLTSKPQVASVAPKAAEVPAPVENADLSVEGTDADLLELPPQEPAKPTAQDDTLAGLSDLELQPDTQPVPESSPSDLEAPDAPAAPPVTVTTDAPAAPPAPAAVPTSPQPGTEPAVTADSLQPPVPQPEPEPQIAELPEPDPEPESAESPEPQPPVVEAPEPDTQVADAPEPETAETSDDRIAGLQPETQPQPEAPPTDEEASVQDNPIAVEGDEDTLPRNQPRILTLPQISPDQPSGTLIGKRVVPITERGNAPTEQAEEEPAVPGKPIEDYAAQFDNPENKPLMSIVLIDDEGAFGAEALQDFPYPLSFAVSPSDPQAAEKMARHRDAGFEVLAMVDMHEAATAQDAEVSLAVWLETLPETVGLLEGVGTGIQGNRRLADQVAAIAGDTGRGLLTQDKGLNTVQKLAARNGVPSSVVFRDFDGARQDAQVMRRFLDQAAFRAGQEGAVVMLGRLRPETISALLLWGLEDRDSRVAMAPISAVMLGEVQQDTGAAEY